MHPPGERGIRPTWRMSWICTEPYDPQPALRDFNPVAGRDPARLATPAGNSAAAGLRLSAGGLTRNLYQSPVYQLAVWRQVTVTQRRTMQDFAHQMRWLVDEVYPDISAIRVVLDNLNTHRRASLYETFPAGEARRIAKRLEFHYTPKHGSWLNMAEKFSVLSRSCLKQRIPGEEALRREVQALVKEQCGQGHHQLAVQHPGRTNQTCLYPSDFTVD